MRSNVDGQSPRSPIFAVGLKISSFDELKLGECRELISSVDDRSGPSSVKIEKNYNIIMRKYSLMNKYVSLTYMSWDFGQWLSIWMH